MINSDFESNRRTSEGLKLLKIAALKVSWHYLEAWVLRGGGSSWSEPCWSFAACRLPNVAGSAADGPNIALLLNGVVRYLSRAPPTIFALTSRKARQMFRKSRRNATATSQ